MLPPEGREWNEFRQITIRDGHTYWDKVINVLQNKDSSSPIKTDMTTSSPAIREVSSSSPLTRSELSSSSAIDAKPNSKLTSGPSALKPAVSSPIASGLIPSLKRLLIAPLILIGFIMFSSPTEPVYADSSNADNSWPRLERRSEEVHDSTHFASLTLIEPVYPVFDTDLDTILWGAGLQAEGKLENVQFGNLGINVEDTTGLFREFNPEFEFRNDMLNLMDNMEHSGNSAKLGSTEGRIKAEHHVNHCI